METLLLIRGTFIVRDIKRGYSLLKIKGGPYPYPSYNFLNQKKLISVLGLKVHTLKSEVPHFIFHWG